MSKMMKLSDIKVKDAFINSQPRPEKMEECRYIWDLYQCQDRYIVVNPDGYLVDGYVQYLVLKENGCDEAIVKKSWKKRKIWKRISKDKIRNGYNYRNKPTTYVYGQHFNRKKGYKSQEYMWRVPLYKSINGFEKDLCIGDVLLVETKTGIKAIEVTRIERLEKCPVDIPVRKVIRKANNKNED